MLILNVKSREKGRNLQDIDQKPIFNKEDPRLEYLSKIATTFKLMDSSPKGSRVNCFTSDTNDALSVTLNGLVDLTETFLNLGFSYVLMGKIQSDRIEGEFAIYRQGSGRNFLISVEQVFSSFNLEKVKLFAQLEITGDVYNTTCFKLEMDTSVEDMELLDSCFSEAFTLNLTEKSSLYIISGYVARNDEIPSQNDSVHLTESEFTSLLSRGKLTHPPDQLYDLSLYLYSFFKLKKDKCCTKIFLNCSRKIYHFPNYDFPNIDSILRRFTNCFFKAMPKQESDNIRIEQDKRNIKRTRMSSNS